MNKLLLGHVQKFLGSTLHNIKSLCVLGLCPCPNLLKPHILGVVVFSFLLGLLSLEDLIIYSLCLMEVTKNKWFSLMTSVSSDLKLHFMPDSFKF